MKLFKSLSGEVGVKLNKSLQLPHRFLLLQTYTDAKCCFCAVIAMYVAALKDQLGRLV